MKIDPDIENILSAAVKPNYSVVAAVQYFLESLPGYSNSLHQNLTVQKYENCLRKGKHNFYKFLKAHGVENVQEITKDILQFYKDEILREIEPQTARGFITAVRQLLKYCQTIGWIDIDFLKDFHLPKVYRTKEIETIPKQVVHEILTKSWGKNPFTILRNHLVSCLFLLRGLHPKEIPSIKLTNIHPYQDLVYITVYGKKGVPRDVMLDTYTYEALKEYAIVRAEYLAWKKIDTDFLILSEIPKDSYCTISIAGVQAIIRRIKNALKLKGCLWDLKALNPQGARRTAVSAAWEEAENLPIYHPEISVCAQFGHSMRVAEKYYWKKSKRNAYLLVKGLPAFKNMPELKPATFPPTPEPPNLNNPPTDFSLNI